MGVFCIKLLCINCTLGSNKDMFLSIKKYSLQTSSQCFKMSLVGTAKFLRIELHDPISKWLSLVDLFLVYGDLISGGCNNEYWNVDWTEKLLMLQNLVVWLPMAAMVVIRTWGPKKLLNVSTVEFDTIWCRATSWGQVLIDYCTECPVASSLMSWQISTLRLL